MNLATSGGNERPATVKRSDSELIRARDVRQKMAFTLLGGAVMEGVVRWFDDDTICIGDENRDETVVYKHALVSYKAVV